MKNEMEINDVQQKMLRAEQLRLLYEAMPLSVSAAIVNSSILVAIQWSVIDHAILIGWLITVYSVTAIRVVKTLLYRKALNSGVEVDVEFWLKLYYVGIGASGIIWGATGVLLFPPDNIAHQAFLVFVLAGMSAGAVTTLSSIMSLYLLFVVPCLLPVVVQFLILQTGMSYAMGFMIALFILMASKGAREISKNLVENITSRLRIAEHEKLLEKSERKLTHLLTSSPVVIYTCAVTNNFPATYISENVLDIFGYKADEFLNDPDFWADRIHPEDAPAIFSNLGKIFIKGVHSHEYRFKMSDGSYRWVHDELNLIRDTDNKPIEVVGYWADINDRKAVEEKLLSAKNEAESANKAKSEFLSRMSHELRTPLNAILGFSQLLALDDLTEEQKDQAKEIDKAGRHLLELINEVLDTAKIDAGKLELNMKNLSLRNVLNECVSIITPLLEEKELEFINRSEDKDDCYINADETRVKQVILNILSNSVKYNRKQGKIILSCDFTSPSRVRVIISDTGYGLTAEQQKNLFQPFERMGAENTDIEGTGIGLVISKRLIELMDGEIGYKSSPDTGSVFWVELNRSESSSNDIEEHKKIDTIHASDRIDEKKKRSVLYIEDNPANLRLVEEIFRKTELANLSSAHTPELGLSMVSACNPDLILLDINLPGINGYEVLNILRKDNKTKNIPVIAISANAMSQDIEKGMAAGFDDYITKPINIDKFISTINRVLSLRQEML